MAGYDYNSRSGLTGKSVGLETGLFSQYWRGFRSGDQSTDDQIQALAAVDHSGVGTVAGKCSDRSKRNRCSSMPVVVISGLLQAGWLARTCAARACQAAIKLDTALASNIGVIAALPCAGCWLRILSCATDQSIPSARADCQPALKNTASPAVVAKALNVRPLSDVPRATALSD